MSIPSGRQPAGRTRDKLSLLRSHPLFRDLPSAVIERLGSDMKARRGGGATPPLSEGGPPGGALGGSSPGGQNNAPGPAGAGIVGHPVFARGGRGGNAPPA